MKEDLYALPGYKLHQLLLEKKVTALEIANTFLDRIKTHNESLGAFLEVFEEDVLKKAKETDSKIKAGQKVGKLAGIPIAIKDNMHIKGKTTTCASKFLKNYIAPFDASVVKRLNEEDALLIGKTNLDEFAMGSTNETSAFFPAKNPWDLTCTPGGSSGGSSASVAARLCPIALGSDTGGSIRQPAAFTGTTGFKPSYGRVSRNGLVAFASSLDQIGPIANDVKDLGLIMEVIGSPCDKDATCYDLPNEQYLETQLEDLSQYTIGVPTNFLENLNDDCKDQFFQSIEKMKELGATIVEVDLSVLKHSVSIYYVLATAEASTNLARFDGIRYGVRTPNAKNLQEVYDLSRNEGFGSEVKTRIMLGTYVLSAGYEKKLYEKAQVGRQMVIDAFEKAFSTCQLICLPTSPTAAFPIGSKQDPIDLYNQDIFTIGANLAGLPAISIPSGFLNEKPLGLQLIGPQLNDVSVIRAAMCFEKKHKLTPNIPKHFSSEVSS